ncbi:DUF4280 domain-containing protein [Niabella soli]|uniref:DUF4280 domain-containing protein n=1 Tax=Niabella soli DSM 19437 TaxID=929713 RepID=W0F4Q5_9BACT|nr:DUF4280 domain-containing protein [Niabella soli]AHF17992.1 hypothetical protein NIASO_18365 [Niabella soli DSM 19437]
MGQLYVPEGTWVLCSEGKKIARIQVSSQATIRIDGGKLAATEADRFDGNFVCFKMVAAGAVIGAVVGAAVVASGGSLLAVAAAGAAGAAAGAGVGGIVSSLPSICSLLCKPSDWTVLHPEARFSGKRALLQKATLSCLLGGTVSMKLPNYQESIDMGLLAGESVYKDPDKGEASDDTPYLTQDEKDMIKSYHRLSDKEKRALGLNPKLFGDPSVSDYHADLYKKDGKYVLVFRGTQSLKDAVEDGKQGTGMSSDYYNKSVQLAKEMKKTGLFTSQNTIITGHSLGGGMAATAGGATGFPTYTYNAAGVHDATLNRNNIRRSDMQQVQAYNSNNDPLNQAQDHREMILGNMGWFGGGVMLTGGLPRAAGQRMELDTGKFVLQGQSGGHAAINAVRVLEQEAKKSGGQTVVAKTQ